ncbi:MAG: hypothetical protein K2Z81_11465, partial [Cyanobacteria bacterium]|nr:hypothetical protein [Cyanobacteriota bacterium]
AELTDAVRQRLTSTLGDTTTPPAGKDLRDWAKLAREMGITDSVKEPVKKLIARELANPKSKFSAIELMEIARDFDVFGDPAVRKTIIPRIVDEALNSDDCIMQVRRLLEAGVGQDPLFRDSMADNIAKKIRDGKVDVLANIEGLIRSIPELELTLQPALVSDRATLQLLSDMRQALKGTALAKQIDEALKDPSILGNSQRLNELFTVLSGHKNLKDFHKKYDKTQILKALQEEIKKSQFEKIIKDPDLNVLLAKRPLDVDAALKKLNELLDKAGFDRKADGRLSDESLKNLLRQRSRKMQLQDAIYSRVEQELRQGTPIADMNGWRSMADALDDPRAANAIGYKAMHGEMYPGRFLEDVKLDDNQLTALGAVTAERGAEPRTPMTPGEFDRFLARFGFASTPSQEHMKIVFEDGTEVTYYLSSDKKLVNATFNAHPHVLQAYQRSFLEGMDWLILNGQPVDKKGKLLPKKNN